MVEPKYPGVVEQYINLGKCYDHNGMEGLRTAIISCMRGYKGHYQRAYRCLDAAAELMYDVRSTLDSDALEEKEREEFVRLKVVKAREPEDDAR